MSIKKIEIRDKSNNYEDILYPKTSIDMVDGLQTELDKKTNVGHTHDDRYYTETEIDTKLNTKANTSHGNHVPTIQTANNAVFLRNDNTWVTVTPANIGAATTSHTHDDRYYTENEVNALLNAKANTSHGYHIPTPGGMPSNGAFLAKDNSWMTITPNYAGFVFGTSNFAGNSTAKVITHGLGKIPNGVLITPYTSPGGNLGEVWYDMTITNISVYNSGSATTKFTWLAF